MRFANHVSVIWDITGFLDWIPAIPSVHHHLYSNVVPTPPVIPQPFGLSLELASIIAHPPGALLGDHKLTSTVYHNHVWFALEGHDLGHFLMHLCIPPLQPGPCTLMEFNIALSSRKAKFTAGEIKANGKAVACCTMVEFSDPLAVTPMMTCGAIPAPNAGCGSAVVANSLIVGMHWSDMLAGWVDVAVSTVQGMIMSMGPVEAGNIMDGLGFNPVPNFGDLAGNGVRLLGQQCADYHGDSAFAWSPIQGPIGEAGYKATVDGASGDVAYGVEGEVRAGGIGGLKGSDRVVDGAGGAERQERSGGATWFGGGETSGTQRENRQGNWDSVSGTNQEGSLPWDNSVDVPFL